MREQEVFKDAVEKWGANVQTTRMLEEMAKLQQELCWNARGADNFERIAERIADVQIMLEQMIALHDCKQLVEDHKNWKIRWLKAEIENK